MLPRIVASPRSPPDSVQPEPRRAARRRSLPPVARMVAVTRVRRLSAEDWAVLREVRLRALEEAPYAFGSTLGEESSRPEEWWKAGVDRLPWHGTRRIVWFVAEGEGRAVGLAAGVEGADGGHPEVMSMWVEPDCRGTGVAGDLLTAVISWAESQGPGALRLVVAEDNVAARRFYERHGFVSTGKREPLRSRPQVSTQEMILALADDR